MSSALKRAFTWHWHLLGLGAGVAVAVLSGSAVLWLPFIAAAEAGYLGFLGFNPRFQNVLKAKGRTTPPPLTASPAQRYQQLMSFLSAADVNRFQTLQYRCSELIKLRKSMSEKGTDAGVEGFRDGSLDRMLWLFLKLLHQRSGLERFLGATRREEIEKELQAAETQLATTAARDKAAQLPEGRLTTSIRERITTIRERLDNHTKASENLELVTAEIDKTEQQITHLCEVGMTMSDAAGLSVQIDSISESLQSSERIFSQDSFSHIFDDEPAPPLLSGSVSQRTAIPQ